MKLYTFLGVGAYQPVCYVWGDRSYRTELFPEALMRWLEPQEAFVFLTQEAARHEHWRHLQERLAEKVTLHATSIPAGRTEDELWDIFTTLTDCLAPGEQAVFDITHAFRSLPVLTLLAASYLRTAKNVNIQGVLYGAFDAKDAQDRAPVFDLSPFLGLLDWVTAADHFVHGGDCRDLAALLQQAHRAPYRTAPGPSAADLPQRLQNLAGSLEALTQSLVLTRPHEAAEQARRLSAQLQVVAGEVRRWAKPFAVLLEQVERAFSPLASDRLAAQRQLIAWYLEHGHRVQAVTLAREWLISWACQALKLDLVDAREEVERAINQAAALQRGRSLESSSPRLADLNALPAVSELVALWQFVGDLRNDVAHCGMRHSPRPARAIARAIDELPDKLGRLPVADEITRAPTRTSGHTYLFNTPVLTAYGAWRFDGPLTLEQVRQALADGFISAVGHEATARYLADLLGIEIPLQRHAVEIRPGDRAVVFRLKERLPEGKILSADELRQIPSEFGLLIRDA